MKTFRAVFWLAVLGGLVYFGTLVIPPYFANYQFQDTITSTARLNQASLRSEQEIREGLYKEAHNLGLPLTRDQIYVMRNGPDLVIWADYTVHIDLPYYPFDLDFHPSSMKQ